MYIYAKARERFDEAWTYYALSRTSTGKVFWKTLLLWDGIETDIILPLYNRDTVYDPYFVGRAYEEGDLHARTL